MSAARPAGIPPDYEERVYAGVVGKLIGVYLGRPVEGWSYERIQRQLGTITGYVHEAVGVPLIVTDDDISGTFTFFRALEDNAFDPDLDPEAIGRAWLNYLIEERTILWWGGLGHSTEHTAYLRLQAGIPAPRSGSAALNGRVVAEQIGSQIFIDGWAMAAPGAPGQAAAFARSAASVSHDGAAVDAAVFLAAMEAEAFVEPDLGRLFDVGLAHIDPDSVIAHLARDLQGLHREEPDWRVARAWLEATYGPTRFKGNVHVVPNHGLILLALLWCDDDFSRALSIVNSAGWDTDCNSGNVGCLMGIKNGLAGMDGGPDWRTPVRDRLYLPSAEGGRSVTDAVIEAGRIATAGYRLVGGGRVAPKDGARFHFSYPGALQGFAVWGDANGRVARVSNGSVSEVRDARVLRVDVLGPRADGLRVVTPTFIPPDDIHMPGYPLLASPTLHSGQVVEATIAHDTADPRRFDVRLTIGHYSDTDALEWIDGPAATTTAGACARLSWKVPDTGGQPIALVGIRIDGAQAGSVALDRLSWTGDPQTSLGKPPTGGRMWRRAWVDGVDIWNTYWDEPFRLAHNRGVGLLSQGSLDWHDYRVTAVVTPHQATAVGIAARVGGMRRWYGLLLVEGGVELVRCLDERTVLVAHRIDWEPYEPHELTLDVRGNVITGWVDGRLVGSASDDGLLGGGVGLVIDEGTMLCEEIKVRPASG